jgi:hypothetical protein
VIVWQSGASSVFPWRVRKGVCGCQRGGLFVTVRKVSDRFVTVRRSRGQLGASSMLLRRVYEGIRRCPRGLCDCIAVRCQLGIPLAGS